MKKTFFAIVAAALAGCIYFETSPEYNSETIKKRELNAPDVPPVPEFPAAYFIKLYEDSIFIYVLHIYAYDEFNY